MITDDLDRKSWMWGRALPFGIIQRYVFWQIVRIFLLALVAITAVFVLFVVMIEATRSGLTPQDVLRILPYVMPSSLPYTVPVALLFAVSVFYGRMAGDNEVMAIKTAGLSVWTVLSPAIMLGAASSVALYLASIGPIPRAACQFKLLLFSNMEDVTYKLLKKEGECDRREWPFYISVRTVEDKTLIDATFKHRLSKQKPDTFDFQVHAKKARLHFDTDRNVVVVDLEDVNSSGGRDRPFLFDINGREILEYPIPERDFHFEPRVQEMTNQEIAAKQQELRRKIRNERALQAIAAAMWIGSGRLNRVSWKTLGDAYREHAYWQQKHDGFATEIWLRRALAAGSFLFVLLGAPVGILFAKRDYLSAFISCFVPIIVVYYPLTLMGVNIGKEGIAPHWIVCGGDLVVFLLAWFVALPPVKKH